MRLFVCLYNNDESGPCVTAVREATTVREAIRKWVCTDSSLPMTIVSVTDCMMEEGLLPTDGQELVRSKRQVLEKVEQETFKRVCNFFGIGEEEKVTRRWEGNDPHWAIQKIELTHVEER